MKILTLALSISAAFALPAFAQNQCSDVFENREAVLDFKLVSKPSSEPVVDLRNTNLEQKAEIYTSADVTFAKKFEAMRNAKHSILVSTFSIKPDVWYARDPIGRTLAEILIAKHQEGLEVKVFTDYWGNPPSTRQEIKRMIKAGVDVRYFGQPRSFFDLLKVLFKAAKTMNMENLNHGKTLVVDGWKSYTGGYNWMSGATGGVKSWRDTDIEVSGPIAGAVSRDFYSIFDHLPKLTSEPEGPKTRYLYDKPQANARDEFIMQAPWLSGGRTPVNDKLESLIGSAVKGDEIFWQSFSFRPQPALLAKMKEAAARGVKFTILTNSRDNLYRQLFFIVVPFMRTMIADRLYKQATDSYADLLNLAPGNHANLYEFKSTDGPLHAKGFLLVRAQTANALNARQTPAEFIGEGGAGTYNVSPNSWDSHIETMMFSNRSEVIKGLYETYQSDISMSVPITHAP